MTNNNGIIQLETKDVIALHADLARNFVVSGGIRDLELLDSTVNAPFQTTFGAELYSTIFDKAAQLCFGLVKNHAFNDGNKQIALHSMFVFLDLNGYFLDKVGYYEDADLKNLIISVASKRTTTSNKIKKELKEIWFDVAIDEIEEISLRNKIMGFSHSIKFFSQHDPKMVLVLRGNCAHFRTWYQSYRYNPSETERAYGINEKEREK